jgi:hypothetical protein
MIEQLVSRWQREADELEHGLSSGKWYSSMTAEEKADFNHRRDVAYGIRKCANELLEALRAAGNTPLPSA